MKHFQNNNYFFVKKIPFTKVSDFFSSDLSKSSDLAKNVFIIQLVRQRLFTCFTFLPH